MTADLVTLPALGALDRPTAIGIAVGGGLGVVNLAVSYGLTMRALRKGTKSLLPIALGGFLIRLVVLAGLVLWFLREEWIDATAFAISFLVLFVVFQFVEVRQVRRHLQRGRAA